MSWQSAKQIATARLRQLNLPEDLSGMDARLADYPDQETKDFLKPGDRSWSLEFHRMVNQAIAREIRRRGGRVSMVIINLAEFYDWLLREQLENSLETRAKFVTLKTS